MIRKRSVGTAALAGWVVWACALPENAPPPDGSGGSSQGGTATGGTATGGTATGGTATGGTATGGTATGGTATGGTTTGGTATGGTATGGTATGGTATGGTATGGTATGGTAGSAAGQGGTAAGAGGRGGTAGSSAGQGGTAAGTGGKGGTAGSSAGQGGTAAGTGGKGGTGGSGGSPPTGCPCLAHRYAFDGTGTTATDSIGTAHGTIVGGTQSGGSVALSGGTSDQYVTLPAGIISVLSNATFEAWVTWTGGTANWQRVFDFGSNDGAVGEQGTGSSYFFFTTRAQAGTAANCTGPANFPRVAVTPAGPTMESCVMGAAAFPTGQTHIAVSVGATMSLYINGAAIGTPIAPAVSLSGITDTHNWLGRSQFSPDQEFAGSIAEFRIYNTARSASQLAASRTAGPDTPPTQ